MQRKIIKVGTSAAVLIPKAVLDEQKMKIGEIIEVDVSKKSHPNKKALIDPQIVQWADGIIEMYKPALKKLADS